MMIPMRCEHAMCSWSTFHLRGYVLVMFLRKNFLDSCLEFGVAHIAHLHPGIHIVEQICKPSTVRESEFREGGDASGSNGELSLCGNVHSTNCEHL